MTDSPTQTKHADWPPFVRRALLDLRLRFAPAFEDQLHSLYGAWELPMSGLPERVYQWSASMCLHPEARRVRAIANAALVLDEAIPTLVGNDTKLLALAAVLFLTDRRNARLFQDPAALAYLEALMTSVLRTLGLGSS